MAGLMVMHHLMEAVIILPMEPIRMVPMALAEASAEALAEDSVEDSAGASAEALAEDSVEDSAGASAEEDDGGKPKNPAFNVGSLGALRIQGC
jgi:hypothetical protein